MVGAYTVNGSSKVFKASISLLHLSRRRRAYAAERMGASYGKLTPGHEEAIYRLRKERNAQGKPRSGGEIRRALAEGVDGEPPVSISADRALKVARRMVDERDALYDVEVQKRPTNEGLALLTRRLLVLAEKETVRLERAERAGRLDANKLGKLANAMTKLYALITRAEEASDGGEPANKGDTSADGGDDAAQAVPPTFADALLEGSDEAQGAAPSPPLADRVLPPPTAAAGV
jgi:hypothetical protein